MKMRIPSKVNNSRLGRYVILLLWILCLLAFEIQAFNREFLLTNTSGLEQITLSLSAASPHQIELEDDQVLTTGTDPFLRFSDLDVVVKSVDINCDITADSNNSQLFIAAEGEPFSEDNSIRFSLGQDDNLVLFPNQKLIDSLRFDLSDQNGDLLICENFVLNPKLTYNWGSTRYLVYALLIGLAVLLLFKLPEPIREKLLVVVVPLQLAMFCGLIIWIDLSYPLTFTYDSGHYLWLSSLIKTNLFSKWDIIRNLIFPLHLQLSTRIFGDTSLGLLVPMIMLHLVTFVGLYWFVVECTRIKSNIGKLLTGLALFLLVGMDPTVTGYYHVVLTEYLSTSIAVVSVVLALTLYRSKVGSSKFWVINVVLILLTVVSWHIKQPYIGASLFPHLIAMVLMLFRKFNTRLLLINVCVGLLLGVSVVGTTMAWESFLATRGNPLNVDRQFSTWLNRQLSNQSSEISHQEQSFIKYSVKKYLTSSNFFALDRSDMSVVLDPSLTRAAQNRQIAQNIYIVGRTNLVGVSVYKDALLPYYIQSSPPEWINNLMLSKVIPSNIRFSLSFLLLPIVVFIATICWFFKKGYIKAGLLILTGSSLLNALIHVVSGAALDRYFFWGFPLNMTALIIVSIVVVRWFANKMNNKGYNRKD